MDGGREPRCEPQREDATDDAPLDRVRRAKARQRTDHWLDGGAVAAGALVAVGPQVAPAFAFAVGVPESALTALTAAALLAVPVGAYVAGYLGGPGEDAGARHGAAAVTAAALGAAFAALLLARDAAVAFLGGLPVSLTAAETAAVAAVAALVASGLVGAAVGSAGGRRRERHARMPPERDP